MCEELRNSDADNFSKGPGTWPVGFVQGGHFFVVERCVLVDLTSRRSRYFPRR